MRTPLQSSKRAPDPSAIRDRGQRQPILEALPPAVTPTPPSTKPAPGRRINQRPPAQGPGSDNVRAAVARLNETEKAAAPYAKELRAVFAQQAIARSLLGQLARLVLRLTSTIQQAQSQTPTAAMSVAMLSASRELISTPFPTVAERQRAVQALAERTVSEAMVPIADQLVAQRADQASALVNETRDALFAGREELERARFERDVDVTIEADPEFQRKVQALRDRVAGMPVFHQAPFFGNLYRRALDLDDEGRQRLIEAACMPLASELVRDGAAKLRRTTATPSQSGEADKALNAASAFLNRATDQLKARAGSDSLIIATEVQRQLEICFNAICGTAPADPASVSGAAFSSWMDGGKSPMKLARALTVDPTMRWLTRPLRSKSSVTLPPWGLQPNVAFSPAAGKAGAR
jgi:hypothetical protein